MDLSIQRTLMFPLDLLRQAMAPSLSVFSCCQRAHLRICIWVQAAYPWLMARCLSMRPSRSSRSQKRRPVSSRRTRRGSRAPQGTLTPGSTRMAMAMAMDTQIRIRIPVPIPEAIALATVTRPRTDVVTSPLCLKRYCYRRTPTNRTGRPDAGRSSIISLLLFIDSFFPYRHLLVLYGRIIAILSVL